MRANRYGNKQIPSRAAIDTRIALPTLRDGLSVVDTGGDIHFELAGFTYPSRSVAGGAGLFDNLARAATVRTGRLGLEHT